MIETENVLAQQQSRQKGGKQGLSESRFRTLFSAYCGEAPKSYLNRRRLIKAKELLLGSNEKISAIAIRVGFSDPYYFSRKFRQEVGCSPSAHRHSQKNI